MATGRGSFSTLKSLEMETQVKEPRQENENRKVNPKREKLKALSAGLQALKKSGAIDTVNEGLKSIYEEEGHDELNTLRQWNEKGYKVKKGSEALLLWGSPVRKPQDDSEDEFSFFPLCFVFSNLQVERR